MPKFSVTTFGCQMNVHDSTRMSEVLRGAGWTETLDEKEADLVVLNTCSVREKAEHKLFSAVGKLAKLKKEKRDLVVAVAGCLAQQEGERLLSRMKQIDVLVGPDNIPELPRLVEEAAMGAPPVARTVFDIDAPVFLRAEPREGMATPPTAFVTIMKGCNERCSFCIVPYTRGPERYRPSREIVEEIAHLVESGVREVTLLGQTVNSYQDPEKALPRAPEADPNDPDESEFAALLRAIAERVPKLARLRYTSPHPRHIVPSLIAAHRDLDVLAKHVHMPVQSGSDRMLKRMIRRYTSAEYIERAGKLVSVHPGMTLSTDIIVGFSSETDEDFEKTLELVRTMRFRGLFGFKYSRRPYTPALKLQDDVSEEAKSERLTRLFELSEALLQEHLSTLVGTRQKVLVEGPSKTGDRVTGRTERNEIVHIAAEGALSLVGKIVDVTIGKAFKHSLEGLLDESDLALLNVGPAPQPKRALPLV